MLHLTAANRSPAGTCLSDGVHAISVSRDNEEYIYRKDVLCLISCVCSYICNFGMTLSVRTESNLGLNSFQTAL